MRMAPDSIGLIKKGKNADKEGEVLMNISSVGNGIANPFSSLSTPSVARSGATQASQLPPDSSTVTTFGQLWHTLDQLRQQDPQQFVKFAQNAAAELQAAAKNQPPGKTKDFLHGVSNLLKEAAANPNNPLPWPKKGDGTWVARDHALPEETMTMLNQQASALLGGASGTRPVRA